MKIYEDQEDRILCVNKKGICDYLKKKEYPNCNFYYADKQEIIKKLIKKNKNKKIFWKLKLYWECSDDSSTEHCMRFKEREEIKEYILNVIKLDFWFNGVEITKYELVNKIK